MTERSFLILTGSVLIASALCVREIALATDDTRAVAFFVLALAIAAGQLVVAVLHRKHYPPQDADHEGPRS